MDHAAESVAGDAGSATAVALQQGVDETDGDDKKLDGDDVVEDGDADDDSNSDDNREVASAVLELDPASAVGVECVTCAAESIAAASTAAGGVPAADGTGA